MLHCILNGRMQLTIRIISSDANVSPNGHVIIFENIPPGPTKRHVHVLFTQMLSTHTHYFQLNPPNPIVYTTTVTAVAIT